MKKTFTILILCFFSALYAQSRITINDTLIAYRNAVTEFDSQNYGMSLKFCEDAILYRKQLIEYQLNTLKTSLSAKRVHNAGDDIDDVLAVLKDRKETECINIISYYLKKFGAEHFENSISSLLEFIESSKEYPEAHKLIGDIYKLEGEYDFAEQYYKLALQNADVLDVPDEKYDILYELSEISRLKGDFERQESRLLNVLADDKNFLDGALTSAMKNTIRGNKKDSVEKFFMLYRADSYTSIKSYNLLSQYYSSLGEDERALTFASLCVITGFSKICSIIESRNPVYEYSDLETFFQETGFYSDIIEWGNENGIWESFNNLAELTLKMGYKNFARELLVVLAKFSPEVYWQKSAVLMLENMN